MKTKITMGLSIATSMVAVLGHQASANEDAKQRTFNGTNYRSLTDMTDVEQHGKDSL